MTTITRCFEWDAGHRVYGHSGKCKNLHGHRYRAEVVLASNTGGDINHLGMVIDFGLVKKYIGEWIDKNWDHKMVLWVKDPMYDTLGDEGVSLLMENPTAENLAKDLFRHAEHILKVHFAEAKVVQVTIWETPNCSATYKE